MTRATRTERIHAIQSRVASAVGARSGALLAAVPDDAGKPDGTTSAELWLYGVVGGYWFGFNDKTVADQLRGLTVDHITVRLNSPGGDAFQGIAIGNLLRNHKAAVTVVVDGLAASAASIIAIAGDRVVMTPGSQLMVHDPWLYTVGNAKELRQDADFLDKQGANLAGVYAHEAGGTTEAWRAVMTAEPDGTWYTAEEAVTAKLATEVGTVVAVGAAPEPPAADLDDEDDDMAARAAWDLEVLITPAARAAWNVTPGSRAPKPPAASADGSIETEGGSAVAFSDEQMTTLRDTLGLPESADAAAILAELTSVVDAATAPPAPPPAAELPEGHVAISAAKLADLEAAATLATTTAKTLHDKERGAFLDGVRDKFLPTSRAGWAAEYDRDEVGVRAHFATAPVLIPTAELGHGGQPDKALEDELYAAVWGPEKTGA